MKSDLVSRVKLISENNCKTLIMGIYQLSMDFYFIMVPAEFGITLLFLFLVIISKLDKYFLMIVFNVGVKLH